MTDLTTTTPQPLKYHCLTAAVQEVVPAVTIVAHPCDQTSLPGALGAVKHRLIVPVLVAT